MNFFYSLFFFFLIILNPGISSADIFFNRKDSIINDERPCNGHVSLCNKRYNEVVYVTTHNSFNAIEGEQRNYLFPNQDFGISTQLKDGIRGFMIDVHPYKGRDRAFKGKAFVYHGFAWTGNEPLDNNLQKIKHFLDSNPSEVITIILECYVSSELISASMKEAGLAPYLFSYEDHSKWPTLREMINSGKRLVVFTDSEEGDKFSWYHFLWDYCVETAYSARSMDELNCDYNRGKPGNSLFILNHFITRFLIGTGYPELQQQANSNPFCLEKVKECMSAHNKLPNFLTVDFYSRGNMFEVARELNGIK